MGIFLVPGGVSSGGGGTPPPTPTPPGLSTYLPNGGQIVANGFPALGRWEGVEWTGPYGAGEGSFLTTDPPAADGFHAAVLSGFNDGSVDLPAVLARNTTGFSTKEFKLILPVPPGATGIDSIQIGTNVSTVAGANVAPGISYNPLNGGAFSVQTRNVAAPDAIGTLVDIVIAGPLAAPTAGHVIELRYFVNLQPGGTDAIVSFTRLVIDWT